MAAEHPSGSWWRFTRSVRFRITALATLVLVLVLGATGVALVLLQQRALTSGIDDNLEQRADDLGAVYASGAVPSRFGVGADEAFVLLVASDGSTIAASTNVATLAVDALPATEGVATVTVPEVDDDPFRLLIRNVDGPAGRARLVVAGSLDDVRDSSAALVRSLFLATPVVAALLASLVWWLVGRALGPVESIRREVSAISGRELHRRVPVPHSGDEIERLAATMNAMLDRVQDAGERQQQFAADASHELRSPLARMRSELEVDLAYPSSSDLAATHRSVLEEIGGLEHLMDDLLHLARSDASQGVFGRLEIDVSDIVRREVEQLRASSEHTVEFDAPIPAWVDGDPRALGRAIGNVLSNAANHAEAVVAVSVRRSNGAVEVAVVDDGPGIPPEAHERVFQRFARLDEARSADAGGTGLGLAIARDIVTRHGGTITIDATHHRGARFVVRLPAAS